MPIIGLTYFAHDSHRSDFSPYQFEHPLDLLLLINREEEILSLCRYLNDPRICKLTLCFNLYLYDTLNADVQKTLRCEDSPTEMPPLIPEFLIDITLKQHLLLLLIRIRAKSGRKTIHLHYISVSLYHSLLLHINTLLVSKKLSALFTQILIFHIHLKFGFLQSLLLFFYSKLLHLYSQLFRHLLLSPTLQRQLYSLLLQGIVIVSLLGILWGKQYVISERVSIINWHLIDRSLACWLVDYYDSPIGAAWPHAARRADDDSIYAAWPHATRCTVAHTSHAHSHAHTGAHHHPHLGPYHHLCLHHPQAHHEHRIINYYKTNSTQLHSLHSSLKWQLRYVIPLGDKINHQYKHNFGGIFNHAAYL